MPDHAGRSFEDHISRLYREFQDPEEERAYLADVWPGYGRRLRTALAFAAGIALVGILGTVFGLTQAGNVPAYIATRLLMAATFAILLVLSFASRPSALVSRAVCLCICISAIAWVLPQIADSARQAQGPSALMAALTLHLLLPVRYWHMMVATAVIAACILADMLLVPQAGPEVEFSIVILAIALISARTVLQAKLTSRFRFFARRELDAAYAALRQKEHELEQSAEQLRTLIFAMDQGVSVIDRNHAFVVWNPQFERLLDLPANLLKTGMPLSVLARHLRGMGYFGQRDMDERRQNAIDAPRAGDHFELPLPGGRYIDVRRSGLPDGGIITTYTDITDRKKTENMARLLGMQDPLTQLANRALFLESLVAAIAEAQRFDLQVGLLMIDLDHFKPVNDTYGHLTGDAVLKQVAVILRGAVRELDTVARLGGDEFAVVLTNLSWPEQADLPARRILAALQQPMQIDGHTIRIGGSIGIAFFPQHGATPEALMAQADAALYAAKGAGRNCIRRASDARENRPRAPER